MTQSQKVKHCEHGVNPRQGVGILQKNEILEVKTVDPFNASFSRQPGEYFFLCLFNQLFKAEARTNSESPAALFFLST